MSRNPVKAEWNDSTNYRGMPLTPLSVVTRVEAIRYLNLGSGPWRAEPTGTVARSSDATAFAGIASTRGPALQNLVVFDERQFDNEGDGPYVSSEILARYVKPL